MNKKQRVDRIQKDTEEKLKYALDLYIELMTTDTERNKNMLKDFSMDWKKHVNKINSMQKLIYVSPWGFEEQLRIRLEALKN